MDSQNKIEMVVFDWAGTTVDYGSRAPGMVFDEVLTSVGVKLTKEEINGPMGMEKRAHIRQLLSCESGNRQWLEAHQRDWTEADVDELYDKFEEILHRLVAEYSKPMPGVVETVNRLRKQGLKIGSTTGYTSQVMEQVIPGAKAMGYEADCVVTPDITGSGRPTPFMLFECMRQMKVYPPCRVVKVGDTIVDILEGKNAGAWSIGIIDGSNLLGLSQEEYNAMDAEELKERREKTAEIYRQAGADMVIDSIRELPDAVAALNERLAKMEEGAE